MLKITSRANEKVKAAIKLNDKKNRVETGLFRFEGKKLLSEFLESGQTPEEVFIREDALEKYGELVEKIDEERIFVVTDEVYEKLSDEKSPQGVLCVAKTPKNITVGKYCGGGIVLESVRDCGNLGTILRTAAAFGAKRVYLSDDCADVTSQKTIRAAMGAIFKLDIIIVESVKTLLCEHSKSGKRPYAAMPRVDAVELDLANISMDDVVVVGNEGHGVSEEVKENASALTIPMAPSSESLNAAVAASVILWEMWRRNNDQ